MLVHVLLTMYVYVYVYIYIYLYYTGMSVRSTPDCREFFFEFYR